MAYCVTIGRGIKSFKELVWNGLVLNRFCEVVVQRIKANWNLGATSVLKCPQAPIGKNLVQFGTLLGPTRNTLHLRPLYIYISRLTFRLILLLFQQGCPPGPYCLDYLMTRTCSSCGVRRTKNFYAGSTTTTATPTTTTNTTTTYTTTTSTTAPTTTATTTTSTVTTTTARMSRYPAKGPMGKTYNMFC